MVASFSTVRMRTGTRGSTRRPNGPALPLNAAWSGSWLVLQAGRRHVQTPLLCWLTQTSEAPLETTDDALRPLPLAASRVGGLRTRSLIRRNATSSFFCVERQLSVRYFDVNWLGGGSVATFINTPTLVAVRLPTWITLKMAGSWKNARYGPDKRWASKSKRSSTTRSPNIKMLWSSRGEFTWQLWVVANAASR